MTIIPVYYQDGSYYPMSRLHIVGPLAGELHILEGKFEGHVYMYAADILRNKIYQNRAAWAYLAELHPQQKVVIL